MKPERGLGKKSKNAPKTQISNVETFGASRGGWVTSHDERQEMSAGRSEGKEEKWGQGELVNKAEEEERRKIIGGGGGKKK